MAHPTPAVDPDSDLSNELPPNAKVSVALVTYNHRSFIEQAIESALAQTLEERVEIVIGDDASTDGTREVVDSYQERYPDIVRAILPSQNGGDDGRSNYVNTLHACRGEYVAYLDGDDYWTSVDKLSRQVRLLDHHPNFSACAHRVVRLYDNGKTDIFGPPPGVTQLSEADIRTDFSSFHGSAFMYRRVALPRLPAWFSSPRLKLDDWTLALLCALRGNIGCIPEVMSVYRKHTGGVWSGKRSIERLIWELSSRDFVHRQLEQKSAGGGGHSTLFFPALQRAEHELARDNDWTARFNATVALFTFPARQRLSLKFYFVFLIEAWLGRCKPVLLRLRGLLTG